MGYNRLTHSLLTSFSFFHLVSILLFDSFLSSITTQHRGAGAVMIEGGRVERGPHHLCVRSLKYVLPFY